MFNSASLSAIIVPSFNLIFELVLSSLQTIQLAIYLVISSIALLLLGYDQFTRLLEKTMIGGGPTQAWIMVLIASVWKLFNILTQ